MKILLLCLFSFLSVGLKNLKYSPYTKTGHKQFAELTFTNDKKRLLIDYSQNEIKAGYRKVSRRFFGTNESYFNLYEPAKYQSTVIFSRSNMTREPYVFNYDLETIKYHEVSIAVKGSISAKKIYKMKSGDFTPSGDISMSYAKDEYTKTTDRGHMNVMIYPGKKISLQLVGDAMISSGVSKNFFFGICLQKGEFEIVEVQSTIYELIEEDA